MIRIDAIPRDQVLEPFTVGNVKSPLWMDDGLSNIRFFTLEELLNEGSGGDNRNSLKRMEDQQIMISCDESIDMSFQGAFKKNVIFGIPTDRELMSWDDQEGVRLDQMDQLITVSFTNIRLNSRARNYLQQLYQQQWRNYQVNIPFHKSGEKTVGGLSTHESTNKDIRINDDFEHIALVVPLHIDDGLFFLKGDVWKIAHVPLKEVGSSENNVWNVPRFQKVAFGPLRGVSLETVLVGQFVSSLILSDPNVSLSSVYGIVNESRVYVYPDFFPFTMTAHWHRNNGTWHISIQTISHINSCMDRNSHCFISTNFSNCGIFLARRESDSI